MVVRTIHGSRIDADEGEHDNLKPILGLGFEESGKAIEFCDGNSDGLGPPFNNRVTRSPVSFEKILPLNLSSRAHSIQPGQIVLQRDRMVIT